MTDSENKVEADNSENKVEVDNSGNNLITKISQIGLIIPLVTIFGYITIYYHEAAFFAYYNMPYDFILVEPSQKIWLLMFYLYCFIIIGSVIDAVVVYSPYREKGLDTKQIHRVNNYLLGVYLIISICCGIALFRHNLSFFGNLLYVFNIIYLTLFALTSSYLHYKLDLISKEYAFTKRILSLTILGAVPIIIIAILTGIGNASVVNITHYQNSHKDILLRKYSEYCIYGYKDSSDKIIKGFIIYRKRDDVDTILNSDYKPSISNTDFKPKS